MVTSLTEDVLFAGTGSATVAGAVMVAGLLIVPPTKNGSMVPVTVYVAVPPLARFTVWLIEPEPDAVAQADPTEAEHVHVAERSDAGRESITVAPVTADGPRFVAVTR